jgi:uncharacterized protein YbjQ (UPF0145 family)
MSDVPLPPSATGRLDGAGTLWTSGLAIDEFEAAAGAGFSPAGVVIGTAMCRAPLAPLRWTHSVELGMLTQAITEARHAALSRMTAEATTLGASGVLDVCIQVIQHPGASDAIEILATGTAVRSRISSDTVWTAGLSGGELVALKRTGFRPLRAVFGVCVYHVAHRIMQQTAAPSQTSEVHQYTQALYDGRELALTRMQADAGDATGIVAVKIETDSRVWGEQAVEFLATGTAVAAA